MAKIVSFGDPSRPGEAVWINPVAVEKVTDSGNGNAMVYFRSGSNWIYVVGSAAEVAAKLNAASD